MSRRANLEAWVGGHLARGMLAYGRRALGARVETHRDRAGRATPYLVVGEPRDGTLVWLHGFSDRAETFLPVAARLRHRYRIVIPALPGFNGGWVDHGERHTFEAYGAWMAHVLDEVAPGRFHLLGNSLGGAAALTVAQRLPERVASLTLVCTAGVSVPGVRTVGDEIVAGENLFEVRVRADYDRFMGRVMARAPHALRLAREHLFREQRGQADWYVRILNDMASDGRGAFGAEPSSVVDLASVRTPTLVVWGEHDSLLPLPIGEHVARTIPGAQLHVLRGVGHCPHLERPATLAAVFLRFARELAAVQRA